MSSGLTLAYDEIGAREWGDRWCAAQGEDRLALAACARGGDHAFSHERRLRVFERGHWSLPAHATSSQGDPDTLTTEIPGARTLSLPGCDHFSAIPHALSKAAAFDFLEGEIE